MTSVSEQACYTLINVPSDAEQPTDIQLKEDLENGDVKTKIKALKKVITMILNGEKMSGLLMTVIRFVMPSNDHTIKKLLLVFWEVVPKYNLDGKMLHEFILVCDAYRKDLQHPNEFIRGSTLRFLCKLKEPELLEPLMPSITTCLEHRHSYVRRNAVLAIFTIYKNFDFLIPNAPELIANFLEAEQDASCKRNAFMMLIHADQERALNYLSSCIDQVHSFGDILQLVIVELIYKVCHANPSERARFIRCIYNLLNSSSPAVRYEAAGTLVTLSSAPTAVKAAASCYIELIVKESDNNVKLIVLDRLIALKEHPTHEKILQELVMDILRVVSASDLEVRKKTLALALDLVSSRNIEEMVIVLRKEVVKTNNSVEHEDVGKYRQLLVRTLHQCVIKFPDVAANIIPVLIEFLSDANEAAANDVLVFLRETIQRFEQFRHIIIQRLLETFTTIKNLNIFRAALWILGEYCCNTEDIQLVMTLVRQSLGDIPIVDDEMKRASGETKDEDTAMTQGNVQRLVTADGTYATQSAFSAATPAKKERNRPPLRQFLMDGNFFVGAALATSLTKLALRYVKLVADHRKQNVFLAETMLIMATIIHLGKSGLPEKSITDDDVDRIAMCIRVVAEQSPKMFEVFTNLCRESLSAMLVAKAAEEKEFNKRYERNAVRVEGKLDYIPAKPPTYKWMARSARNERKAVRAQADDPISFLQMLAKTDRNERKAVRVQADDPISFLQLLAKTDVGGGENMFELTMSQALGIGAGGKKDNDPLTSSKLNKVTQLTGFSDPVYAEAYVHVNQYDIVLDVLIVNQTADTLQNLTIELATLGDLKLVDKPQSVTMAPHDFTNIKASVKVASTENGIIFGNIVYDISGASSDRNCVVLNDIHIDIMDYIVPASCTDAEFRQMWSEFEWENKVAVNTNIKELKEYLEHLFSTTNMKCLTPEKAVSGECGFLAANLYAKSIFGEDALANLSIEKPITGGPDAAVIGHIRIRAKSQGMALSLGDKINVSQKKAVKALK